ncbi:MAG TPA: cytidine deaminase [Bacillota bacterium]|nr:cytidine deaminase [Bacillota bacterium]
MNSKEELILRARDALSQAYAPYSGYAVGAAILAGGEIFTGVNVENASYGLTICAERAAAVAAVTAGKRRFDAIAIAVGKGRATPCGACRQFLREFGRSYPVYLVDSDGSVATFTLEDLLPESFGPEFLETEERDDV